MKTALLLLLMLAMPAFAADTASTAATAVNALGIDLLHQVGGTGANNLLSPYSIQTALAMTYAGADGTTREELMKVLHYPSDEAALHRSFAELQKALGEVLQRSLLLAKRSKHYGLNNEPIKLAIANRLFGQQGYEFREPFLALTKTNYDAPFKALDFMHDAGGATKTINDWVAQQTMQRIQNLIPSPPDDLTRLVLVNAIYLKAPWAEPFPEYFTKPRPFHVAGGAAVDVPTMNMVKTFGYEKRDGFTAVTIPYNGGDIQFLILLPDDVNGLAQLEARLTADTLASCAALPERDVNLFLPKFKIAPPTVLLSQSLQALGMKTAFDIPEGSANFDRMAPRRPNDYLYISAVFHKTFLNLDENGTEAAAATAVAMSNLSEIQMEKPKPVEVNVDRPFLFAIQHRASGACLFLGHVADPR